MAAFLQFVKRYYAPIILFSLGLFFQLLLLPRSYPPSHYDVLGIKQFAPVEDVTAAYEKLSARWFSGLETSSMAEFIEIRYAFELLSNPFWKRDYDLFNIDDQLHIIKEQYAGLNFSSIHLPLLNASSSDLDEQAFNIMTSENFVSIIGETKTMLIQVYSIGSARCANFINYWKRIASLLDGVADTGMVELGDVHLASYLAEKKHTKQPFFRNGLPALVAYPPSCKSSKCYMRYQGDLSVDPVVDWMATSVLGLPRILYHTKETLVSNFIAKTGHHKVKVICFTQTGERATPFLRQAAKDYWAYASFAMVLWREEDSSIWWNLFHVETAPAIVFLKDSGVEPVVYHGSFNSSRFTNIMENNKYQELAQLRSVTSMELGCDANGFSRAGNDTVTWYCVILAGRLGSELRKMRETIRRAQSVLRGDVDLDNAVKDDLPLPMEAAASALKEDRLTFTWLDGEVQKKYCLFYLYSENVYETCGPSGYTPFDVPRLFIVRYKRNSTEKEMVTKKKAKSPWDALQEDENANIASQLVARYNGSNDIQEIIQWISQIIENGDTTELPYFIEKSPELVPEETNPHWSKSAWGNSFARKGIKATIADFGDYLKDPRIGPCLLLMACLSFGSIWFQSNQRTQPTQVDNNNTTRTSVSIEDSDHEKPKTRKRRSKRDLSNHERPSSITDAEPKDAYQMMPSDSDSE